MITINCRNTDPRQFNGSSPSADKDIWNYSSTTCEIVGLENIMPTSTVSTSTIASSTDIYIDPVISAGDVLISLLLFLLFWAKLMEMVARGLSSVKTKRKFLGYSGGDVEIREDI